MSSRAVRVAVITAALMLLGLGQAGLAHAAAGDVRRDLPAGPAGGVSVAFDGAKLYYTDRNGVLLHSMSTTGEARADVPIVGAAGVNAIAYDVTHDFFWAVDTTGLGVYKLTKDGLAMPQFVLVPALDLPGLCDVPAGCSSVVSGLAYDATSDTLWYAPSGTQRIYHLTTAGQLVGWFDTNETSGSLYPDCLANDVAGLAAGADSLYVAATACAKAFRYSKSDSVSATKVSAFAAPVSTGDVECDNVTFPATVIWVRSLADGHLRAVEVAPGTCVFGGGVALNPIDRWMSGSGEGCIQCFVPELEVSVQHAFHLLCDPPTGGAQPNNMVINWRQGGSHFSFHLDHTDTVTCIDDTLNPLPGETPPPGPSPPPCNQTQVVDGCFNNISGHGIGRLVERSASGEVLFGQNCNNSCGTVEFLFIDRGEPNTMDRGGIKVSKVVPDPLHPGQTIENLILDSCGCKRANYQAHQRVR